MYLPTTKQELNELGWDQLDVILISGDVYIDSCYDGVAVIGKLLLDEHYKVGIISQPDIHSDKDIMRLGEPKLFWGVSAGCVDSMVANYTALLKKKRSDDLTPGGLNDRRPDRASIIYTNLIRKYFKNTKPIILGGIEASLRRIAHYDYWTDKIRRSILFDAKADAIVYGMGEKTISEIAAKFKNGRSINDIRGICYISKDKPEDYLKIPAFEEVQTDKKKFTEMFNIFYKNNDPVNAFGLAQKHGDRYLIQNKPQLNLRPSELDRIYELGFERDIHPYYKSQGKVKALETIQFSVNSHRGCFGECNFCSIAVHQGRTILSRSEGSIIREVKEITRHPKFKGNISDVGGPTANMYGSNCNIQLEKGSCKAKRCAFPEKCKKMNIDHDRQRKLLERIRKIKGIKKVFIGSGLRYDLIVSDDKYGMPYLEDIVEHHVSGQLKIAPEHISPDVLKAMAKPANDSLLRFKKAFEQISKRKNKKQYLTYYLIAAHPGCNESHMKELKHFLEHDLSIMPEQVQIFTPTPSTYATLMYHTEADPYSDKEVFIEKNLKNKRKQKEILFKSAGRKK
jgi:uncharacterized radical SAM protein YgiQ